MSTTTRTLTYTADNQFLLDVMGPVLEKIVKELDVSAQINTVLLGKLQSHTMGENQVIVAYNRAENLLEGVIATIRQSTNTILIVFDLSQNDAGESLTDRGDKVFVANAGAFGKALKMALGAE